MKQGPLLRPYGCVPAGSLNIGVPTDGDTRMLLSTCHGCGDDLAVPGKPANLLCPRCQAEAVWLRN